jgi:intergrase/recombinase
VQVKDVDLNGDLDFNGDLGLDFHNFEVWVRSRYAKSYAPTILSYVRRYYRFVIAKDLRTLDAIPATKKNTLLKSLIVLSKYMGQADAFRAKLRAYDIKISRPSTLSSFLRIFNSSNNNILKWYREARSKLRENEALYTEFLLRSGLRTSEAIHSFNLIMRLGREGKLSEYYDSELQVLCHFKYPKLFIRRTKNCYITFIQSEFLQQITESEPVTYSMMSKRLDRKHLKIRFNELRDKFETYLLSHGILEAEINLCQGRIPVDIFIRHYWSPKLKELGCRIFKALEILDAT